MVISKTSQKLHFRVTKKDTSFPFHSHVLNLFKSWSNLGFDQKIQMGIKIQKKIKRMKKQRT
jgi:hypothetical protein